MRSREDLVAFVRSLPISEERREVVQLELEDHFFEELAELEARGISREDATPLALASLGSAAEMRARLVPVNEALGPLRPWTAALVGARVGASMALALVAIALITEWCEQLWREVALRRGVEPRELLPYIALAMCLPVAVHFAWIRPVRLARRLSVEVGVISVLALFSVAALVSSAPLELAVRAGSPLELHGEMAMVLLGLWALHGVWLALVVLLARKTPAEEREAPLGNIRFGRIR